MGESSRDVEGPADGVLDGGSGVVGTVCGVCTDDVEEVGCNKRGVPNGSLEFEEDVFRCEGGGGWNIGDEV